MNKKRIDEAFEQLRLVQSTLELLKNLKIHWETDLEKMNFSLLRSKINYDIKNSYIDKLDLTKTHHWECAKNDINIMIKDKTTLDLIELINKGNRIIPPLYVRASEYDGETYSIKEVPELQPTDGGHRLFLSAAIELEEIPIIIHEKIVKYSFPVDKWNFEYSDESFVAKSKNGEHKIEIDNSWMRIDDSMYCKNILVVMT